MSVEKRGESRGDGVRVNPMKRAAAFRKVSCRDTSLLRSVLADNTKQSHVRYGDTPGGPACLFRSSISLIILSFPDATTVVCSAGVDCSGVSVALTGTGVVAGTGGVEGGNRTDDAGMDARSALDLFFSTLPRVADRGALVKGGAGAATGGGVADVTSGRLAAAATAVAGAAATTAIAGGVEGVITARAAAGAARAALAICAALAAAAVAAPTAAVLAALADARATSEAASR